MRKVLLASMALLAAGCGLQSTESWLQQLKDSDVVKRRQAIRELGSKTGDAERVVPVLQETLSDENPYVRHDAALALAKFGAAAKPATPVLARLLKDRDLNVRKAAGEALKKIDPEAAAKLGRR